MKDTGNVNSKIEKAQTHRVTVEAEFVVITPIMGELEAAQAMAERLVRDALEPLSPAKNLAGDIAVLLKVSIPTPKPKLETLTEVPEGYEIIDSEPEEPEGREVRDAEHAVTLAHEPEPEQPEVQTRRDDSRGEVEAPITRRARVDGWTEPELDILKRYYPEGVDRVERELAYYGFRREPSAITSQASKMGFAKTRSGITPAGRAAMSALSDVGEAVTKDLHTLVGGDFTYFQVYYGLRKAEVRGLVKAEVLGDEQHAPIKWRLTAKGRGMTYANGGNGGEPTDALVGR